VMKGVTLRSGGVGGGPIRKAVTVASGELVITDKRVLFAGDRKSFAISLEDLLSITPFTDGFGFSDGDTTRILVTGDTPTTQIFGSVLDKVLVAQQTSRTC
jgi:hypothetical protein